MNPADELRTAAEKLRKLATGAAPGPWTVNIWGNVLTARDEEMAEVWPLGSGTGNAEFIAAMHPGVGIALADWLDFEAALIRRVPGAELRGRTERALAVARAINGTGGEQQ